MYRRCNRLLLLVLSALFIVVIGGCSQPEDVLSPASTTKLVLRPERLPALPTGMIYELWVKNDAGDPISLGKFDWNDKMYQFSDSAGNKIDSIWAANFDVLKYKWICVSVEKYPDPEPNSMGPVMLQDTIVAPEKKPIKMLYPVDLWLGQAGFAETTPTDGNSLSANGSGLWFSLYVYKDMTYKDTTGAYISYRNKDYNRRPLTIDTIAWDSTVEPPLAILDTLQKDSLSHVLDTIGIVNVKKVIDSNYIIFLDTLVHISCTFDFITVPVNIGNDTIFDTVTMAYLDGPTSTIKERVTDIIVPPFSDYNHSVKYLASSEITHRLDQFLNNSEELPDLRKAGAGQTDLGWHYKGWILSPFLKPESSFGTLTKPSWSKVVTENLLRPSSAGLITTGSFKSFDAADYGNPYSMNKRVPPFPGEDFLVNLPSGVGSEGITFGNPSDSSERAGTVFITLEPDNYDNANTNFPLVLMISEQAMPDLRTISDSTVHQQDYRMANWFRAVDGDMVGFPTIHVILIRE